MTQQQTVKVQLVKSPIGTKESHRATVRGLGLRKLNSVSELQDTPAVRGMINKISYLVKVLLRERLIWNSMASSRQRQARQASRRPRYRLRHRQDRGRGHKGQKSRAGGFHKVGFEGGQMPLQRRLPKRGFKSQTLKYNAEVTLTALEQLGLAEVDLLALKQAGLVGQIAKVVKIIKTGELTKAVKLTGIGATAGAKAAIEAAGGSVA